MFNLQDNFCLEDAFIQIIKQKSLLKKKLQSFKGAAAFIRLKVSSFNLLLLLRSLRWRMWAFTSFHLRSEL